MGIRHIGEKAAKILAKHYKDIDSFVKAKKEAKKKHPDTMVEALFMYEKNIVIYYFSIRIRASTATTALAEPRSGLRSISAISGAALTSAEMRVTASANRSSFTGS